MIWGAISLYGVSPLIFMDGRQDSSKYCQVLRDGLLPFASGVFGEGQKWSFQQGNAPIHTPNLTKQWLLERSITTLPWPAKSPDINIIENVWGIIARTVYVRGKHYENVEDLKVAFEEAWATVASDLLLRLYKSLACMQLWMLAAVLRSIKRPFVFCIILNFAYLYQLRFVFKDCWIGSIWHKIDWTGVYIGTSLCWRGGSWARVAREVRGHVMSMGVFISISRPVLQDNDVPTSSFVVPNHGPEITIYPSFLHLYSTVLAR